MTSVDRPQLVSSPQQCMTAAKLCRSSHLSRQQAVLLRRVGQSCRSQCTANSYEAALQSQWGRPGALTAASRPGQHAGIRPKPAAARHTASAASADFASGAAEDFRSADMVADSSNPIAPISPAAAAAAVQSKGLTGLAARVVFGTALGVAGALVILTGGWCYMISACFVAYQASREYFGFLTSKVRAKPVIAAGCIREHLHVCRLRLHHSVTWSSKCTVQGISEGMQPPPPLATTITTLCCIGLVFWTFISRGKSTAALAIAALLVLSLQLLTTKKPRFSQLTSSVFGLFYCGASVVA